MAVFRGLLGLFMLTLGLCLGSCSPFRVTTPPVILLLFDSVSEQDFLCSNPADLDRLKQLDQHCQDLLRFTHMFAPSNMLQPNLASLMTGQPFTEHNVVHNGDQVIPAELDTLAEVAIQNGRRTAFFSGGLPLLPKFGITQGFETYTDGFDFRPSRSLIPIRENIERAFEWIDREVSQESFFMTIYMPDLLYSDQVTLDQNNQERPMGRKSNLLARNEAINEFIAELKKRRLWDMGHIFFLGVAGAPVPFSARNPLSGHHYHMPFQVKPSSQMSEKIGELSTELTSFDLLGRWLKKIFVAKKNESFELEVLKKNKYLPQTNALWQWLGIQDWPLFGLRSKDHLFTWTPEYKAFESFIDKKELEPLEAEEALALSQNYGLSSYLRDKKDHLCRQSSDNGSCQTNSVQLQNLIDLKSQTELSEPLRAFNQFGTDWLKLFDIDGKAVNPILTNWLAYQAIKERKWTFLFELGKKAQKEEWTLVAQRNLADDSNSLSLNNCMKYFKRGLKPKTNEFYRSCEDVSLKRVIEGLWQLNQKKKPSKIFWSEVNEIKRRRNALDLNFKLNLINDVRDPLNFAPTLAELFFYLPENRSHLSLISSL